MASVAHAGGLAAMMAAHQQRLPSYEQQLHVIYLANDVLLKRCSTDNAAIANFHEAQHLIALVTVADTILRCFNMLVG